jgi:hypothetical protein
LSRESQTPIRFCSTASLLLACRGIELVGILERGPGQRREGLCRHRAGYGRWAFLEKLVSSAVKERLYVVRLGEHKDPSGLYWHDREGFKESFTEALRTATPWSEIERERKEAAALEAWAECGELARKDIHSVFADDLQRAWPERRGGRRSCTSRSRRATWRSLLPLR